MSTDDEPGTGAFDPARSWRELLQPGKADHYFAWPGAGVPPFRPEATGFDPVDAWWLAELSRLAYRRTGRDEHLESVGLTEIHRIEQRSTQCSVFAPSPEEERRFSIVVFEGTADLRDWLINFDVTPVPWEAGGRVHQGFANALRGVWTEIAPSFAAGQRTFFAGHSLGGALATLACSLRRPSAAYTFGAPRVGDARFAHALAETSLYRIVLHRDVVPTLPPAELGRFRHAGQLRYINGAGAMLVDPSPGDVAADQGDKAREPGGWRQRLGPAEPLADHAPIRYVEALATLAARNEPA